MASGRIQIGCLERPGIGFIDVKCVFKVQKIARTRFAEKITLVCQNSWFYFKGKPDRLIWTGGRGRVKGANILQSRLRMAAVRQHRNQSKSGRYTTGDFHFIRLTFSGPKRVFKMSLSPWLTARYTMPSWVQLTVGMPSLIANRG